MGFERTLVAGWGDMDFNAHMRNTAYLDKSADVRMMYFAQAGFPMSEFMRLRLGPVVREDVIQYYRETHLLQEIRVLLSVSGLSEDGARFSLRNEFTLAGHLAARVTSLGGWLDLQARRLATPPAALLEALRALDHSEDFAVLPDLSV